MWDHLVSFQRSSRGHHDDCALYFYIPFNNNNTEGQLTLGAIFILRKDIGVGGPENGNFPLLYVVKLSLRRWVGGSKKPQNTLT